MANIFTKIFGGLSFRPLTATPGDAADGDMWYDSALGKFRSRAAGVVADVGSGSGGGGGVNLLTLDSSYLANVPNNNNFESTIGTWYAYQDAAAVTPVDMTGGTPNSAITRNTTAPINGAADGLFTINSGASRQGEGLANLIYLPPGYRGRTVALSFPFITSGTLVEDDLRLVAYQVDGAAPKLLGVTTFSKILGANGVAGCFFTPDLDATQIRVGVHIARTTTGALTLRLDDVTLGIGQVAYGDVSKSPAPAGVIVPYAGVTAPEGWMICDGTAVSRTTYSELFSALGITHGQGDGSTTFNVPDYRGRFLRGRANGSANDPDRASRTAMATGGTTGDNVGSVQGHQINAHAHGAQHKNVSGFSVNDEEIVPAAFGGTSYIGRVFGGNETRPVNAYVNYIVKLYNDVKNATFAQATTFKVSDYLASGTRVTATAPTALGQYRSYLRNANAQTFTETNGNPTAVPSLADGIRIYNGNVFTSADTNNEPTRYEIFVGKNKNIQWNFVKSAARTGNVDANPLSIPGQDYGYWKGYDPTTGIAWITAARVIGGAVPHHSGLDDAGGNTDDIYFDITVSEAAIPVAIDLSSFRPVGATETAMLTEAQIQAQLGTGWILSDGRSVTGSKYHALGLGSTVPDLRGMVLRGKNNGRSDGNQNPDGDSALGTYQADSIQGHSHLPSHDVWYRQGGAGNNLQQTGVVIADGVGGGAPTWGAPTVNGAFGTPRNAVESRSKNVTVNHFIKIN